MRSGSSHELRRKRNAFSIQRDGNYCKLTLKRESPRESGAQLFIPTQKSVHKIFKTQPKSLCPHWQTRELQPESSWAWPVWVSVHLSGPKAITRCSGVAVLTGCHPQDPVLRTLGGAVGLTALEREHLPGPLGPCVCSHGGPSSPEPLSITILQEGLRSEVCRQAYRWINACVRELLTRAKRLLPGGFARTLTCAGGGEKNSHTGKHVGGSA